jgi:hypothetical protein
VAVENQPGGAAPVENEREMSDPDDLIQTGCHMAIPRPDRLIGQASDG